MNKNILRTYFKNFLKQHYDQLSARKSLVAERISDLIEVLQVKTVGLYYPTQYEINLFQIMKTTSDLSFFLPKIIGDELEYHSYSTGDILVLNKFNIYEPITKQHCIPELIIVPGLAFNSDYYRLGYGKGFFDRYLRKNSNKLFSVGVCLKEQISNQFSITAHDHKLNMVIAL